MRLIYIAGELLDEVTFKNILSGLILSNNCCWNLITFQNNYHENTFSFDFYIVKYFILSKREWNLYYKKDSVKNITQYYQNGLDVNHKRL